MNPLLHSFMPAIELGAAFLLVCITLLARHQRKMAKIIRQDFQSNRPEHSFEALRNDLEDLRATVAAHSHLLEVIASQQTQISVQLHSLTTGSSISQAQ